MKSFLFSAIIVMAIFCLSALGVPSPIDLGFAKPYAILAGSTVTSSGVSGTIITGNLALYPGTEISGFPPAVIHGAVDLANTAAFNAQGSLTTAYNLAAGLEFNTSLSSMDLGGMTLHPSVYNFAGAAAMNGMLTLDANGDANAVWVFQIVSSLLIAEGSSIIFKDDIGNPDYVYWQVGSSATIGPAVPMIGNVMAFASITANSAASLKGRFLARNAAVTLDNNLITKPSTVSFSATQTISGISLEQYNADPTKNSATLKEAIAETMTGVLPSNIENFAVTAGPTSASATTLRVAIVARALSTSSIILNYVVTVSSTLTAEELQAQLNDAVADGTFNTFLQTAATDNGDTDLQGATSEEIETETITNNDTGSSSSSDSDTLSAGAIAGIVIGGVVALVLIAALIYYFACSSGASAQKSSGVETTEV